MIGLLWILGVLSLALVLSGFAILLWRFVVLPVLAAMGERRLQRIRELKR